jgi:small-conductance mechanosensitive channel
MPDAAYYAAAEKRIEYVALAIGAAGTIGAAIFWSGRAAVGMAVGALLSWLNYRWMKQGVGALAGLSKAQHGAEKVRVPPSVYVKFIGRYVLLILSAYVILTHFSVPVASLLAGFGAVVVAALVEVVAQLLQTPKISTHS